MRLNKKFVLILTSGIILDSILGKDATSRLHSLVDCWVVVDLLVAALTRNRVEAQGRYYGKDG